MSVCSEPAESTVTDPDPVAAPAGFWPARRPATPTRAETASAPTVDTRPTFNENRILWKFVKGDMTKR
jgi:hypothetical protein